MTPSFVEFTEAIGAAEKLKAYLAQANVQAELDKPVDNSKLGFVVKTLVEGDKETGRKLLQLMSQAIAA